MENEISKGAMLGIVLIALAAVIALAFGVFSIAKGTANDGVVQVQDSLAAVSQQQFTDFDQRVVNGSQVSSALKNFEGKPVAVLIATKQFLKGQVFAAQADHAKIYTVGTKDGNKKFVNYNALIAGGGDAQPEATVDGGTMSNAATVPSNKTLTLENGTYITEFGLASTDGNVQYDNSTAGIFKSGNCEYVSTTAKFQANLIKDASGTIFGVAFEQM